VVCGRETPKCDSIVKHSYLKDKLGFIEVSILYGGGLRSMNFCPLCAKKSYSIEELKIVGNYNKWSY
jgi:hypothetical protein